MSKSKSRTAFFADSLEDLRANGKVTISFCDLYFDHSEDSSDDEPPPLVDISKAGYADRDRFYMDIDLDEPPPLEPFDHHQDIMMSVLRAVSKFTELETMPPTEQMIIAGALHSLVPCTTIDTLPSLSKITSILIRSCTDERVPKERLNLVYSIILRACDDATHK